MTTTVITVIGINSIVGQAKCGEKKRLSIHLSLTNNCIIHLNENSLLQLTTFTRTITINVAIDSLALNVLRYTGTTQFIIGTISNTCFNPVTNLLIDE